MSDYNDDATHHGAQKDSLDLDFQPASKDAGGPGSKPRVAGGPAPKNVGAGPDHGDISPDGSKAQGDKVPPAKNLRARIIGRWTQGEYTMVLVGAGAAQGVMRGMDAVVNLASGQYPSRASAEHPEEGVSTVTETSCRIGFRVSHDQLLKESGMQVVINPG